MSTAAFETSVRCPQRHGGLTGQGTRAVFLDRDGVLIEDTGYPDDPAAISLLPGVVEGLTRLRAAGWRLVVVTNQSGIARGKFTLDRLSAIHARLLALLTRAGIEIDALYYCPHHPEAPVAEFRLDCDHRKPLPGMLLTAARTLDLDLARCWMVGDKEGDVQAGHAAGCRAVRLTAGASAAEACARDLLQAAELILALEARPASHD